MSGVFIENLFEKVLRTSFETDWEAKEHAIVASETQRQVWKLTGCYLLGQVTFSKKTLNEKECGFWKFQDRKAIEHSIPCF